RVPLVFFFSSRRRHTILVSDWSSDVCSSDLFWALRGGGGNFGVVTSIEFEVLPVRGVYAGALFFDAERAAEVLHTWTAMLPDLQIGRASCRERVEMSGGAVCLKREVARAGYG